MIAALLVLILLLPPQTPAETERAYEAVLRSLRSEHPELALYLANLPRERYGNLQGATEDGLLHDPRWVRELQSSGVISGSCTPPKNVLGCPPPDSLAGREFISAIFWPVETTGERMAVPVTLRLPPVRGRPSAEKREYSLTRTDNGQWRIESYKVVGVA